MSSIGQALLVTDEKGIICQANKEARAYFKTARERILNRSLKEFCMLEDPDEIDQLISLYKQKGEGEVFTDDVKHFGRWYHVSFSRLADRQGEFVGVLLNIQDIHERMLLEHETRESANELASANRALADTKDRIEKQAGQLVLALEELKTAGDRIKEQNENLLKDLGAARRIQQSLLPRMIPDMPELRFNYKYSPCEDVGGDFFDISTLDSTRVAFYLADVSGHGVAAAMLAVFAKQVIKTIETHSNAGELVPPNEVLQRLNEELIQAKFEDMPFLTIFYGILDTKSMVLSFSAAAQPAPLLIDSETGSVRELDYPESSPLGWFEDAEYSDTECTIGNNQRLLLYTDGVTEIFNPAGDMIETDEFHQNLVGLSTLPPDKFSDGIFTMIREFTQKTVQDDDITLITMDCLVSKTKQEIDEPSTRDVDQESIPEYTENPS